jgi:hypothetical protein
MNDTKSKFASKTIWANLIAGAVTIGTVFGLDLGLTPETQAELVAGIMVLVNIALRFVTDQGIK